MVLKQRTISLFKKNLFLLLLTNRITRSLWKFFQKVNDTHKTEPEC